MLELKSNGGGGGVQFLGIIWFFLRHKGNISNFIYIKLSNFTAVLDATKILSAACMKIKHIKSFDNLLCCTICRFIKYIYPFDFQNSKRVLRSNEIIVPQGGLIDTELDLTFSLQVCSKYLPVVQIAFLGGFGHTL